MNQIRLGIVDDHKIMRAGIKLALKNYPNINIIVSSENGEDFFGFFCKNNPNSVDVILLDLRMPVMNGLETLDILFTKFKEVRIIILTMYDDPKIIVHCMENGASGYLTKTSDPVEIAEAIMSVFNGDKYYSNDVKKTLGLDSGKTSKHSILLSDKEKQILKLCSEDKTTEEISKIIYLSPRTIETIRQNLKQKNWQQKTIAGLMIYAIKNNLIP